MNLTGMAKWSVAVLLVGALAMALPAADGRAMTPQLKVDTQNGWARYVAAVEARRSEEWQRRDAGRFFVMDALPGRDADRRRVLAGELVVRKIEAVDDGGKAVDVPSALTHHWRGAVFLRGVTLASLLARLESEPPPPGPDVLESAVLARGPSFTKVFLRVQRSKVITVVYDTEHDVRFVRDGHTRAASTSVATRIVEVDNPGTADERERQPGDDRGFLWRLNAYWRYEEVPGGVIAECESISLSRSIPFGLQTLAQPIIGSTARESMERTLESLRRFAEADRGSVGSRIGAATGGRPYASASFASIDP